MEKHLKKPRASGVTPNLRRAVWDMYIGSGQKEALCPLCGDRRIFATQNSGFECAHIVAHKFLTEQLSVYYLFPSCAVCNNECVDCCLLDYLWVRQRYAALRHMIMVIFHTFVTEHTHTLDGTQREAQLVLRHLYARPQFLAGGLQNVKQVCEIARQEQIAELNARIAKLAQTLCEASEQLRRVADAEIKPQRLTGV